MSISKLQRKRYVTDSILITVTDGYFDSAGEIQNAIPAGIIK